MMQVLENTKVNPHPGYKKSRDETHIPNYLGPNSSLGCRELVGIGGQECQTSEWVGHQKHLDPIARLIYCECDIRK